MRGVGPNQYRFCFALTTFPHRYYDKSKKLLSLNWYLSKLIHGSFRLYRTLAWRRSRSRFLNSYFSRTVTQYLKLPVRAQTINMFEYLLRKKLLTYRLHQQHL